MLELIPAALPPLDGLDALLADIGAGANGFGGTPVGTGDATAVEYLARCVREAAGDVPDGYVPMTTFFARDARGEVVGMVRVRHRLNDALFEHGGHIGYAVRSECRGRGHGKRILALALRELRGLGETRALVTTDATNPASIAVIEANGGVRDRDGLGSATGGPCLRYWFELRP